MPRQITARRVAGDTYQCTSETSPRYTDSSTWSALCRWADRHGTQQIDVLNQSTADGELPRISYRPAIGVIFDDMPRPAMARNEIETQGDAGHHDMPETLSRAFARSRSFGRIR